MSGPLWKTYDAGIRGKMQLVIAGYCADKAFVLTVALNETAGQFETIIANGLLDLQMCLKVQVRIKGLLKA